MSTENTGGAETLTAEESAFLAGTGDLPSDEPAADQPVADEGEAPQSTSPTPDKAAAEGGDPDDPDGTITIDEDGKRRDKKSGRFVPHGAFHQARERAKAAEAKNTELATTLARVNERLAILSQAFQPAEPQPQQAAKAPPKPEEDIFGYAQYLGEQLQSLQKQHDEALAAQTRRLDESDAASAYMADARAFARATPDFGDAYKHLVGSLDRELQLRGWTDAAQRRGEIARLEREEIAAAKQVGRRPAEWIYEIAKMRGYAPASNPPAADKGQASGEPGAVTSGVDDKLSRIERGQNASRSLSSAGGNAPAQLTAEALANMSEAEFDAVLTRMGGNPNAALRKLLGNT